METEYKSTCRLCDETCTYNTKSGGGIHYTTKGKDGDKSNFICTRCILGLSLLNEMNFARLCNKYGIELKEVEKVE